MSRLALYRVIIYSLYFYLHDSKLNRSGGGAAAADFGQVSRATDKSERLDEVTDEMTDGMTPKVDFLGKGKEKERTVDGTGVYLKDTVKNRGAKDHALFSSLHGETNAAGSGGAGVVGVHDTHSMTGETMLRAWYTMEELVSDDMSSISAVLWLLMILMVLAYRWF